MSGFWARKLVHPISVLLKQGISHEKITLSIALGFALGIFPVLGTTTILCTAAAFRLRLNVAAIQMVNFLAYPLQLVLFVPFLRVGRWFFGNQRFLQPGK